MRTVEICQEDEWLALRPAWDRLLSVASNSNIFLTWEWVNSWWSAYGTRGELRILAAFDEHGVLRGAAPLRRGIARRYGQTVPVLSFIGDGSNDSDYLDFLVAPGYEAEVLRSFRERWDPELGRGTVLLLHEIPESSATIPFLQTLGESPSRVAVENRVPCGTVPLPGSWEQYLAQLRPRFRTKIRSVLREWEGRPEITFGFCETQEEVDHLLPVLFDLHTRRWALDAKPGVFGWKQKRDFYATMAPAFLERGWLRFCWLKWHGKVLACQLGFAFGGSYYLLQEGYEPASEHWNLGIGLRAWSIQKFIAEGLREYDFLGGHVRRHRSDWGAQTKYSKNFALARTTYRNLVFCNGPQWEERARESVKNLIPDRFLALRQARAQQRETAAAAPPQAQAKPSALKSLRSAAAQCYFHLGLPSLTRPLRDGYQLSFHTARNWPRISWKKRAGSAARILYYHRVNDDNDPFFPAISTTLFEQEMRFLARSHKVVSLAEATGRLENGSTEPVLAITFDDGYRDNFDNAFPILERYGLPATVFLTTGSLDGYQPLWFEKLASAIKTTPKTQIDLEIDLPRRFFLRTEEERLRANDGIFSLLRSLPDRERRHLFPRILEDLSPSAREDRKSRMLSWDQVRCMKGRGIDFGGHTVTHPFLSKLNGEDARWEVTESKRRIEEEMQSPVDFFAYPNGREEDFTASNKALLRSAGYRSAVTTIWGMNDQSTDPMELRRGGPWEETPALFATKLDWYQLRNG